MNSRLGAFFIILIATVTACIEIHAEEQADHDSVEITINSLGDMQVKHVIKDSDVPQHLMLIDGVKANISVRDIKDNDVELGIIEDSKILIPPSDENIIVSYDLLGELVKKDGMWTLDFRYGHTTSFYIPDGIDLIFANGKPVHLAEKSGIVCHGCYMLLEYAVEESRIFENVVWEENEFLVEIRTLAGIEQFEFDQPSKSIRFDVLGGDRFVTTIIPIELLGNPYSVFFDDEKIHFSEYINNGTHVWLNAKPGSSGVLEIMGTTVIPEFSLMIPLVAGFALIILVLRLRVASPRRSHTSRNHTRQFWYYIRDILRHNRPPMALSQTA